MDETKLLLSKITDLAYLSQKNCYPAFSKFLDASALARVAGVKASGCTYFAFGGYPDAERKVVGCFPESCDYMEELFPICTIKLVPSESEGLTHRDYLGSLIGLGIKRECLGDIVLYPEGAYVLCLDDIGEFILRNITKIGRRRVQAVLCENEKLPEKTLKRMTSTVASERLDCLLSQVTGCSRNKAEELIRLGKVQINYLPAESASKKLKPSDVVSVRGFGKFIYIGAVGETKKRRYKVEYDLYI